MTDFSIMDGLNVLLTGYDAIALTTSDISNAKTKGKTWSLETVESASIQIQSRYNPRRGLLDVNGYYNRLYTQRWLYILCLNR